MKLCGRAAGLLLAALGCGGQAAAQSVAYTRPHVATEAGPVSVTFEGRTFVNQGLVGMGRLPASTRDFAGETLGSFSGLALDAAAWRRLPDGSYAGRLWTLPDRGPNDVGPIVGTTDYANRIHTFDFTFRPLAGSGSAAGGAEALRLTPTGGFFLTDAAGERFTGRDPGAGAVVRNGVAYPFVAAGAGAGRIALDSEAVTRLADGTFYVGDEYGPMIHHFGADGRQTGAIAPVAAVRPVVGGHTRFTAERPPDSGRRNNQGFEGVSVTPDQRRLVALLQSATVQDSDAGAQQTRNNARLFVYDISRTPTPAAPLGEYVLQLPVYRSQGDGGPPDRTAAQSELVALNDHQVLVLSRDSNGRGSGAGRPLVFKSVLIVDTRGATNLAGSPCETEARPLAVHGDLAAGIVPVRQAELVNLINPFQLARVGLNTNTSPSDDRSLPEKIEAMGLAPALDRAHPHDVFLFVGDDNDFETGHGHVNGIDFDASLKGPGGAGDNDDVVLVYRLTLPTYTPARPQRSAARRR